jgi:hypothetical protein
MEVQYRKCTAKPRALKAAECEAGKLYRRLDFIDAGDQDLYLRVKDADTSGANSGRYNGRFIIVETGAIRNPMSTARFEAVDAVICINEEDK